MLKRTVMFSVTLFLLINIVGCEAFVRKFTRKSKKKPEVEMVLVPEEWKGPGLTPEQLYKQYLLFWQSWQDELITALTDKSTLKKRNDCVQEAIKNLGSMSALLKEPKQKQLEPYIKQMQSLQSDIKSDVYGYSNNGNRREAEKLRRNILQKFSFNDIKGDLK
jgi:hypothetical protein